MIYYLYLYYVVVADFDFVPWSYSLFSCVYIYSKINFLLSSTTNSELFYDTYLI
jgi:hypothetical protein